METFQCPRCELRFRFATELDDHLARDHSDFRADARSVEDSLLAAAHRHRTDTPGYPPRYRIDGPVREAESSGRKSASSRPHGPNTITVTHEGGDRFAIATRGHTLYVDQPAGSGGLDSAPTPTELYVASLVSCVAFFARRFMLRHGLGEVVKVMAEWTMAERPSRVGDIDVAVTAPSVSVRLTEQFLRVIEHCTVHNSFTQPPEVAIRLVDDGEEGERVAS